MDRPQILLQGESISVRMPACDHYAGNAKLMYKSLLLKRQMGPIFDITFDCEDGAAAGDELAHAKLVAQLAQDPANKFGRLGARLHHLQSHFFTSNIQTIVATCARRPTYVMAPKCDSFADAKEIGAIIAQTAQAASILIAAQKAIWGSIQHVGRLHNRASYRHYSTILQRARTCGLTLPEAIKNIL